MVWGIQRADTSNVPFDWSLRIRFYLNQCWRISFTQPQSVVRAFTKSGARFSRKAAIASLTQCLGLDHAHQGIRVNAVCPNEVDTPMLRSGFKVRGLNPDKAIEELNKSIPLGRVAQPEDIVDVILFLLSDESRYMCGSLVEVNGAKPVI